MFFLYCSSLVEFSFYSRWLHELCKSSFYAIFFLKNSFNSAWESFYIYTSQKIHSYMKCFTILQVVFCLLIWLLFIIILHCLWYAKNLHHQKCTLAHRINSVVNEVSVLVMNANQDFEIIKYKNLIKKTILQNCKPFHGWMCRPYNSV